ncbi:MAG: SusC/RagA family TonB-linked outer membrane protein [Dysgonomonas sp.]
MKRKIKKCVNVFLLFMLGMLVSSPEAFSQGGTISVRGNVKDNSNEPVISASVVVKGTTTGVMTDLDGNYLIANVPSNGILVFSFLGYQTVEVPVAGKSRIDVVMEDNTELLKEVIVIGYGSVKKEDATGSITAIKVDEMNKGVTTTAQDLLSGKIAGVTVVTSGGRPGDGASIRIRGGSSLTASNDPLVIVDGMILSNDLSGSSNFLSTINPADIESFTVLKDASATAIYGSRASNGVIMITTKKGKSGKPRVAYNGNFSLSTKRNSIDVLNGDEYRQFVADAFSGNSNEAKVLSMLGQANTDWQDEIFRTAFATDHNISVYGATLNVPYRASLGYTSEDGILETSKMERWTANFALSPSLLDDHLKLNINGKGMFSKTRFADTGAIGSAISFDPTQAVTMDGSKWGGYFTWLDDSGELAPIAGKNPVAMLEMQKNQAYVRNFIGNFQADYKLHFFPDLKFNMNLGLDIATTTGQDFKDPFNPTVYNQSDDKSGSRKRFSNFKNNQLFEFYTQYVKDVEPIKSKFDAMAGYSWQHYKKTSDEYSHYVSKVDGSDLELTDTSDFYNFKEYYLLSYFGRFNYTYNDRYLLTFTMRRDGSSRFTENNRWGTFPSLALAWKMKEESFLKDVNVLSDLKLRLGWGKTGQQDLGDDYYYPSTPSYTTGKDKAYYPMGYNENGSVNWVKLMRPSGYNPNLKWETTTTWNAGIDYAFLNGRISGAFDVYFRKTDDLLNREAPTVAGISGAERIVRNIGTLENNGIEFSINARPISTKDLEWSVGLNVAYNKGEITKLLDNEASGYLGQAVGNTGGDGASDLQRYITGYAPRTFYVYQQIYDNAGNPIEGAYVDRNEDGEITDADLYLYKKPAADVLMGFNSKVTYKKWDFGFNGRVSLGNYVYNAMAANNASLSASSIFANSIFLVNRPTSAFETNFQSKRALSDYYVQNASFLKIDNITLGYTFNKVARVYATVQNPIVITKYDGLDPEVFDGIDYNFYPRPLKVLVGVNLNF